MICFVKIMEQKGVSIKPSFGMVDFLIPLVGVDPRVVVMLEDLLVQYNCLESDYIQRLMLDRKIRMIISHIGRMSRQKGDFVGICGHGSFN